MDHFCGGRGFWGPFSHDEDSHLDPNWDYRLDFSSCFEDVILANIPVVFILVVGLTRMLAEAGVAIYQEMYDYRILTPAVQAVGYMVAMALLIIEHDRGKLSSGILTGFWFMSLIVDAIRMRSFILQGNHGHTNWLYLGFFIPHVVFDFMSFIYSCSNEPADWLYARMGAQTKPCPEQYAPLFSLISFWWLNPLMLLGHKKALTDDDLWELNPDDQAAYLAGKFRTEWRRQLRKGRDKASLSIALFRSFGGTFSFAAVFKAAQDVLAFVSPQLLKYLIRFTSNENQNHDQPKWHGYALATGLLVAAIIQSICLHQYFHRVMKTGMRLRSALINAVYSKALVLSNTARQSTTSGEIVNLMAVDAQRFMDLMSYLHMIWSGPLQIALSLYFLWELLGPATLAGVAVMILMIPLNGYLAKKSRDYQKRIMKEKDSRIKLMNEILNGIKVLKLYAWERPFASFVGEIRNRELDVLKSSAYLNAVSSFSWTAAPFLVSLVTFITYTVTGNTLTAEKAFVSLSLFNLLRFPLAIVPMMISSMVEASVSLNRLRTFFLHDEKDPTNVLTDPMALHSNYLSDKSGNAASEALPAFFVRDGTFSWNQGEPLLKDISFQVATSSLTAVIGRVGSGKSSLVSCLLGDMNREKGSVVLPGRVAYVPQQAWIRNATVRDNICFGRPFEQVRYDRIIQACALEPDLKILPGRDLCEIGERGVNLSGGQKARISLARAVYQDADVYLLDDPLSAVDSHVAKHIFRQVLGRDGLLKNKARLLVTHALHVLPQVDQILLLKGGCIAEKGNYDHLMSSKGDAFKLFDEYNSNEAESSRESTPVDSTEPVPIDDTQEDRTTSTDSAVIPTTPSKASISTADSTKVSTAASPTKGATESSGLITVENAGEGNVKGDVYLQYFRAITWRVTFGVLFVYVLSYAMQVGSNKWLDIWSSEQAAHDEAVDDNNPNPPKVRPLEVYLGVYAALGFGNCFGVLFATLFLAYGSVRASRVLHENMLHRIVRAPMKFFDTTPMGRIVNRFSKDMYIIDETIPRSLRSFMSTFLQVVSIVVVISFSTPLFMAIILPMGLVYYYIQRFYVASSRQLKRLESVSRSPIYAHFSETLNGVSSIRAYRSEQTFMDENEYKINYNLQAYYPSVSANRWLALRLEFMGNLIVFFAALFVVVESESKKSTIDPGTVGLSLSYAMSVTQTLNWMVRMSSDLETNIVAIERVEEYCQIDMEAAPVTKIRPAKGWPVNGDIDFDNYSVRYREGLDLVLRGISVQIKGGQKIGCVGRTGAGKSSLTLALLRILEAAGGSISIDGQDISKFGLEDLRSRITIMPQDPVIFSGTIRRNLDPFARHSDADMWRALETCHLADKIRTLDGGLSHEVAEAGSNFSIGESQLMCLSRAVLRKTKVLVLDEATAAVDLETDELIQQTIRTEFKECTIFTIAHRLNTILDSDRIMVLDQGQVVEFDEPTNLLSAPKSIFYGMAQAANLIPSSHSQSRANIAKAEDESDI